MSQLQGRVCPIFHFNWLRSIGVAVVAAGMAHAVTITVPCSGSGGGPGGLAAAINTANSTLGPNTINLTPGCAYTLSRTYRAGSPNGLPPITGIITINGYGATIGRSQVVGTPTFRLFAVLTGGNLTLNVVTVRGGSVNEGGLEGAFDTGGGLSIEAGGKLTLNHSVVTQNHVGGAFGAGQCCGFAGGGGIYNLGTVTLNYSLVSNNIASSGNELGRAQGGGIYNRGALNLQCSTVTHNTATQGSQSDAGSAAGGGIFSAAGRVIVRHSVVSYNTASSNPSGDADVNGGGIVVKRGSTAIVAYSVIRNNIVAANGSAGSRGLGGGIDVEGAATLYRSAIFSNTVTSSGSDFTGWPNAAGGGLAIPIPPCVPVAGSSTCSTGTAKLYYVAIYGNSTHAPNGLARGGGIEAGGPVSLNYTKVVNNTAAGATLSDSLGGGIFNSNSASGAVILTATTVADNHPDQCDPTGSVPGCSN